MLNIKPFWFVGILAILVTLGTVVFFYKTNGNAVTGPKTINNKTLPWANSTCGNNVCEACENSCCNYPATKDRNGTTIYPPPACMGKCEQDCKVPEGTVECGEPDVDGNCANGCVYFGVPLGCVTKEYLEGCNNNKYPCPQ